MQNSDRDSLSTEEEFEQQYALAARAHIEQPGERGLQTAYELGRRGLSADYSMLQLVGLHMGIRRRLTAELGADEVAAMDAFLLEALAAFEITQRGYVESQESAADDRARVEWLRRQYEAYFAIASPPTLEERAHEVCVQSRQFFGAQDVRLTFGPGALAAGSDNLPPGEVISTQLPGSDGRLSIMAPPGKSWTDADRIALSQLAVLIAAPIDDARRLELAQHAGEFGSLLGGVTDRGEVLERVRRDGAKQLGADQVVIMLDDDDAVDRSGTSDAASPPRGVVAEVNATGQPAFLTDPGATTWAVLPLIGEGGRLGVLAVGFVAPQPFDAVQRSFLDDVRLRLIAALERSRAYERERTARQGAERASDRLRRLQELAEGFARAPTRRRIARILLRRAIVATGAMGGCVAVGRPSALEVLAATGPLVPDRGADGPSPVLVAASRAVQAASTSTVIDVDELADGLRQQLSGRGARVLRCYPIASGRQSIGMLVLATTGRERLTDDELVQAQVAMAGPSLDRVARYDVEHDIADTLQRSILSQPTLSLPSVRWSADYRPGGVGLVGGDWYDLIALDDHRCAIVIGDVVGRGVQASAAMGQLRSATRALASLVDDPAELLGALDDFTATTGQGRYSTLALAVLDTRSGELTHSIAGHPPPIMRLPDGRAELLESGRGPVLGIACQRRTASRLLAPGTHVVLYTDGLVERRGEPIDEGIRRLLEIVAEPDLPREPETTCRALFSRMLPKPQRVTDDVAIVVVEFTSLAS